MLTLLASLISMIAPLLGPRLAALPTGEGNAPVIEARVLSIAPNIRTYELRSTTLFVPVADQASFDAAAEGFADLSYSIRTHLEVELTNTSEAPLFISYGVADGIEGTSELTDQAADRARSAWRLWPVVVGEPMDPEPCIFLAPGRPLRHTFVLASRLEPFMFDAPVDEFPATLSFTFMRSTRGFPVETEADAAASVRVHVRWFGEPEIRLSDVSF